MYNKRQNLFGMKCVLYLHEPLVPHRVNIRPSLTGNGGSQKRLVAVIWQSSSYYRVEYHAHAVDVRLFSYRLRMFHRNERQAQRKYGRAELE